MYSVQYSETRNTDTKQTLNSRDDEIRIFLKTEKGFQINNSSNIKLNYCFFQKRKVLTELGQDRNNSCVCGGDG